METPSSPPAPAWKFWHPLPFWKVIVAGIVAQLVATFSVVALREGLGLPVPSASAGAAGGLLMVLAVFKMRADAMATRAP